MAPGVRHCLEEDVQIDFQTSSEWAPKLGCLGGNYGKNWFLGDLG